MKQITCKEFKKRYIYGLKNITNKAYTNEIEFTPERKLCEFKLSKKFPVIAVYNKKEDVTYMFMYCAGYISIFPFNDDQIGYAMKFHGNNEKLIDNLLKKNSFTNFLRNEYVRHDELMEEKYGDEA